MTESGWPAWASEVVELVDHDPDWVRAGREECARLQHLLSPWLTGTVEHIGSTAIPDLSAKPILDFQAPARKLEVAGEVDAILAAHGWHYVPPELDQRPYRRVFVHVTDGHRVAHLHLLLADGARWREQLTFRDALRADAELVHAYARLKATLAQRYRDDREAYSAGKGRFVADVIRGSVR